MKPRIYKSTHRNAHQTTFLSIFLKMRTGKEVGKEDTPNLKVSDRWFYLCHGAVDNSVCANATTRIEETAASGGGHLNFESLKNQMTCETEMTKSPPNHFSNATMSSKKTQEAAVAHTKSSLPFHRVHAGLFSSGFSKWPKWLWGNSQMQWVSSKKSQEVVCVSRIAATVWLEL